MLGAILQTMDTARNKTDKIFALKKTKRWRGEEERGKGMKKLSRCITYMYHLPTMNVIIMFSNKYQ